jgi:putative membrane protein
MVTAGFGLLLVAFLVFESGAADVGRAMLLLGWRLLPIALFHIVPLSFSTLAWRELLPASTRPRLFILIRIRWIRESVNSLLPVAGVGGDVAGARLANQRGVPVAQAAASMVVDVTVGVVTQLIFVISGVTLFVSRTSADAVLPTARALLIAMSVLAVAVALFVRLQHRSLFFAFAGLAQRLMPSRWRSAFAGSASAIDGAIVATYRRGSALFRANLLRLVGWAVGAGEIWLVMHFLGRPVAATDAFVLESLTSGVRAAAFMLPAALGALEGGFVLFGTLLGLPTDASLVVALSRRVRELLLGLPGLFVWHWIEGRHLMRRREEPPAGS